MTTPVLTTLDLTSGKIINLPSPSAAGDAAPKSYVDATAQGLLPKQSAQWATAAVLPNTPTYNNGAGTLTAGGNAAIVVDGGNPVVGDRVLVKNQASAFQNGIYQVTTVGSGGAPWVITRSSDALTSAELVGAFLVIEQGTQANQQWMNTNSVASSTAGITIGTTAITWTLQSGPNAITTSGASNPVTITGSVLTYGTAAVAVGGTGQITPGAARGTSGLGAATVAPSGGGSGGVVSIAAAGIGTKVTANIGDGATTAFVIAHNLGTQLVTVAVLPHAGGNAVLVDWNPNDSNHVTVTFGAAPAAGAYDIVITG